MLEREVFLPSVYERKTANTVLSCAGSWWEAQVTHFGTNIFKPPFDQPTLFMSWVDTTTVSHKLSHVARGILWHLHSSWQPSTFWVLESQHLFENVAENPLAFSVQKSSCHLGSVKLLCCIVVVLFRTVIFLCLPLEREELLLQLTWGRTVSSR